MTQEERYLKALTKASENAQRAFEAMWDSEHSDTPDDVKRIWAMASLIHCDMTRMLVGLAECRVTGMAKLLWMGDIISKLFEANKWFSNSGRPALMRVAKDRGYEKIVAGRLKAIHDEFPISKIETFSKYRKKFSFHYDPDALEHLREFGNIETNSFYEVIMIVAMYALRWVELARQLIKGELPTPVTG